MTKERLRKRVETFRQLLDHNFNAMEQLAEIRLGYNGHNDSKRRYDRDEEALFSDCVDSVRRMIWAYTRLANLSPKEADRLRIKLRKLVKHGSRISASIKLGSRFGYDGTSVMDDAFQSLFAKVENLSPEIARPTPQSFHLGNIRTLHDMIRYIHQKGLDEMFHSNGIGNIGTRQSYQTKSIRFTVQDIGNGLSSNAATVERKDIKSTPLEEMLQSIDSFKDKRRASFETVNAIVDEDYLNAHMTLGCHSADLTAFLGKNEGNIELKYNETHYTNAKRRQEYLARCLAHFGFNVQQKGQQLHASFRNKTQESTKEALQGATRALLTCKDLDLSGYLDSDEDVNFAFDYFVQGGANPQRLLKFKHIADKVLSAGLEFNEAFARLEHSLKPRVKGIDEETVSFFEKYLAQRLAAQFTDQPAAGEKTDQILKGEYATEKPKNLIVTPYDFNSTGIFETISQIAFGISEEALKHYLDTLSSMPYHKPPIEEFIIQTKTDYHQIIKKFKIPEKDKLESNIIIKEDGLEYLNKTIPFKKYTTDYYITEEITKKFTHPPKENDWDCWNFLEKPK